MALYYSLLGQLRRRLFIINFLLPFIIPWSAPAKFIEHVALTRAKVNRRLALKESTRSDFFSPIISLKEELPFQEITANASILIIAGSETSASALTAAAYYLGKSPACMEKMMTEVRGAFVNESDITADKCARLKYLNAVIEEILRIYPPAAAGAPRYSPGFVVDGVYIPRGMTVSVDTWTIHHDPRYWKDPHTFRPERWLDNDPENTDVLEASQPFLWGPRSCLGVNLAYLELRLTLATMAFRYDWELVNPEVDLVGASRYYVVWNRPDIRFRFTPKK
jgi:cytochrome P450